MSGDTLVWFLAGIGVGLAVAMLALLVFSIADRRSLSRQRRQRDPQAVDQPAAAAPQAIRLTATTPSTANRAPERSMRSTPRQQERSAGHVTGVSHDHEPDFGLFEPSADIAGAERREPELVFDLTDLPEVATPAVVDAYVPSFDPPAPEPQMVIPAAQVADRQAEPAAPAATLEPQTEEPEIVPFHDERASRLATPKSETLGIRRPAPPPKPLPAAARTKQPAPTPPLPTKAPAPVSIAPLRSATGRVTGDGSKAPANFRPLLPKSDAAGRPVRAGQRRPFTEITVPFEAPPTLAAPTAEKPAETPSPRVEEAQLIATTVAPPSPQPGPDIMPATIVAKGDIAPAVEQPAALPTQPADEATLDNAAAQSIEQGSGSSAIGRASAARVEKPLPKMPPPRLTPDTVEAIFAEAFARGSAEPPDRKS